MGVLAHSCDIFIYKVNILEQIMFRNIDQKSETLLCYGMSGIELDIHSGEANLTYKRKMDDQSMNICELLDLYFI